jgi:hypothetical protein
MNTETQAITDDVLSDNPSNHSSYQHLFDISESQHEMANSTIEQIYSLISEMDREFHFFSKINLSTIHHQLQDSQSVTSAEKVDLQRQVIGSYWQATAAGLSAIAVVAGPGGIFSTLARAAEMTSTNLEKTTQSKVTGKDHSYSILSKTSDAHSQLMHSAQSGHAEARRFFDQFMQHKQRLIELLSQVGSSA